MELPKIYYKKLVKVWGYAHTDKNIIELSHKLKGRKHLEILLHEIIHIYFPDYDEESVKEYAKAMSLLIWRQGYRRKQNPK